MLNCPTLVQLLPTFKFVNFYILISKPGISHLLPHTWYPFLLHIGMLRTFFSVALQTYWLLGSSFPNVIEINHLLLFLDTWSEQLHFCKKVRNNFVRKCLFTHMEKLHLSLYLYLTTVQQLRHEVVTQQHQLLEQGLGAISYRT